MKTFDNVAKLKLATLTTGQFVETGGYYTKGGGGAAKYLIVTPQAADGYGDHVLANGNVAVLQDDGEITFESFGVTDSHPTGQSEVINAALAAGVSVKGQRGNTYTIQNEINYPAGSIVDWNGATIKPVASFPNTEPFSRVIGDNVTILNKNIDGNKANLINSFTSGATGCGVLIGDNIDNVVVRGGRILNCPTNGYLVFGSNMRNITFDTIIAEENGFIGYGIEIENVGDIVPTDIKFLNVTSRSNTLGGLRIAGGRNVFIDDCESLNEGNSAAVFYIGDANGGLVNCKVSNCYFHTLNAGVDACVVDGEVRTGPETGSRNTCDVNFNNVTIEGSGGGTALRVEGGAAIKGSLISGSNSTIGFYADDGSIVDVSGTRFTNASDRTYILDCLCYIDGMIAEFWGATKDAVTLTNNANNSILRKVRLGASSGETGDNGVGVTGTPDNIFLELKSFTGNGVDINTASSIINNWDVYDFNKSRLLAITDGIPAPSAVVGSAKMYVDAGTGDLKIIFGDGVVKTIVTDI